MVYAMSLGMGLIVGIFYAVVGIRSPAPPIVALVGLLGIVLGEQAVGLAKQHFAATPKPTASSTANSSQGH
jgi:XapX domain-containing protein